METIIVYVDDAAYARQQLAPMGTAADPAAPSPAHGAATHWVLVACAPRMTHRISKWVSFSARENWRTRWSEKLFGEISPGLRQRGDRVTEVLAKGPLPDLSAQLTAEHPGARLRDERRPKLGLDLQPAPLDQKAERRPPWTLPGSVAAIGMMFMLATE